MDTKPATTNIRIKQWMAVFKAKAEFGLTVHEYCDWNAFPGIPIITSSDEQVMRYWNIPRPPL